MKHRCLSLIGMILLICSMVSFAKNNSFSSNNQASACRCEPNQACWPNETAWAGLQKQLTGRLVKPQALTAVCQKEGPHAAACKNILNNMHNPFFLQSNPSGMQYQGWVNAWRNHPSEYAVEAKTSDDIVAAVNFARAHKLRVAIKATGHDYLGRSNAPASLLIWTHNMRQIDFENAFRPAGCPHEKGVAAVTVGAGINWLDVYQEATSKRHRFVLGGGCTSVGVAGGFNQGGGFGVFSKKYGTGAANILQVEVVTADGKTLIANQCQHSDLFWAIRGGGGGTFGVVTKITLKTHPLPQTTGFIRGSIVAKNDDAYQKLIPVFLSFSQQQLNNANWGNVLSFNPKNSIDFFMFYQNLKPVQVEKTWDGLRSWLKQHPDLYVMQTKMLSIPPHQLWDIDFWKKNDPDFVIQNPNKDAPSGQYWLSVNTDEVSRYWSSYQSRWLPLTLFEDQQVKQFSESVFKASRLFPLEIHSFKGLAGASPEAISETRLTSTHPSIYSAAGLVIISAGDNKIRLDRNDYERDSEKAKNQIQRINQAMAFFIKAAPNAGSYVNEGDYFQTDWQKAFWGSHYARLFSIKQKYDPAGLFYCHHCVGSELWNEDGMCRK